MAIRRQSLGIIKRQKKIIKKKKKTEMGIANDRLVRRMGIMSVSDEIKLIDFKINKTILSEVENSNILLTVALPVFNSNKIVWLALESLCNQKNISFNWELLICEEEDKNVVGIDFYREYIDRLIKVNCVKITYIYLNKWVNLAKKWQIMGNNSHINSKAFLLQASDCYSPSIRLSDTYNKIVELDYDWYDNTKGFFYSFISKRIILYDITSLTNLSMGFKTKYARNIPNTNLMCGIDGFLYKHCLNENDKLKCYHNDELYFDGLDTHGLNNISKKREEFFDNKPEIFKLTEFKLSDLKIKLKIIKILELL